MAATHVHPYFLQASAVQNYQMFCFIEHLLFSLLFFIFETIQVYFFLAFNTAIFLQRPRNEKQAIIHDMRAISRNNNSDM